MGSIIPDIITLNNQGPFFIIVVNYPTYLGSFSSPIYSKSPGAPFFHRSVRDLRDFLKMSCHLGDEAAFWVGVWHLKIDYVHRFLIFHVSLLTKILRRLNNGHMISIKNLDIQHLCLTVKGLMKHI